MTGLTRTQASVLASMRSGFRMFYKSTPRKEEGFWLNNVSRQGCTASARVLEREGYIERVDVRASGGCELVLTEKGKTV